MARDVSRETAAPDYFREPYVDGRRLVIKTTCDLCGFVIIDTVPDLIHKEWQHRSECRRPKAAKA